MRRCILHIDMNSFFASVEQQANPWLRGRAIGVGGRPGSRSIVAAASPEAKRQGVATAMGTAEAAALCPDLTLVTGSNRRYHAVSRQIIKLILQVTPDVEVFSVDECFADITQLVGQRTQEGEEAKWQAAADVGVEIKRLIRTEVGEWLNCSIGVAENKILAKLASETLKPDGLHLVTPSGREQIRVPHCGSGRANLLVEAVDDLLERVALTEICGLGPRLARHLERLGIRTVWQLRQAPPSLLRRIFGVTGSRLWEWGWGIDDRPLAIHYEPVRPQSISRSITLPPTLDRPVEGQAYLYDLTEQVGWELRRQGLAAQRLDLWTVSTEHFYWHGGGRLSVPTETGEALLERMMVLWRQLPAFRPIRQVGMRVSDLVVAREQTGSLLPEDQQRLAVCRAQDALCRRFGQRIVCRASWLRVAGRQSAAAHAFGFSFREGELKD